MSTVSNNKIIQEIDELFKDLHWNFSIGELKEEPMSQGAFKLNGLWYLYKIDKDGEQVSLGAFTDKEFLYVLMLEVKTIKEKTDMEYDSELLSHIHNICKTHNIF